jgi:RNA polymerase sigma-70 factor (ECF subfamily)
MPIDCQHTLWTSIRSGNEAAFRQLFDHHWQDLYTFASRITRDPATAQDAVQSLFIHLWEIHSSLPAVTAIHPYLRTALKHRLLNAMRDESLYQKHVDTFTQIQTTNTTSQEKIHLKETEQHILQSINRLPNRMKEVFYMNRVENLTVTEIATRLGSSPQTIRNQLNTALQRMKQLIIAE